jgi:hypothetical protein
MSSLTSQHISFYTFPVNAKNKQYRHQKQFVYLKWQNLFTVAKEQLNIHVLRQFNWRNQICVIIDKSTQQTDWSSLNIENDQCKQKALGIVLRVYNVQLEATQWQGMNNILE